MKIDLIIPVYNEQDFLADCLDSIQRQSLKPDKVILINNNSTDQSLEIIKRYPFVTVINETRQGVFYARTKGFDYSKADLMIRIDADSILPVDYIETVSRVFTDQPDLDAVTGSVAYYDCLWPQLSYQVDLILRRGLVTLLNKAMFLYGSNMVIKKSAYLKVRDRLSFNPKFHEDIDLALHCQEEHLSVVYKKELLVNVSSRRFAVGFKDFMLYALATPATYFHHKKFKGVYFYPILLLSMIFYVFIWFNVQPVASQQSFKRANPIN